MTTLVWLRRDLRLSDHLGLSAACEDGRPLVPFYQWCPQESKLGGASRVWLHESLAQLDSSLRKRNSRLFFFHGPAVPVLSKLLTEVRPKALYFHSSPEPTQKILDEEVCMAAKGMGVDVRVFNGEGLGTAQDYRHKTTGRPYRVFTPFYKVNLINAKPDEPLPAESVLPAPPDGTENLGVDLEDLRICPEHPWTKKIKRTWTPGEVGAQEKLREWEGKVGKYTETRDFLFDGATSQLSPHLAFGEISPREVWYRLKKYNSAAPFLRQICWREFGRMLLEEFPHTESKPLDSKWEAFDWCEDKDLLVAWQKGRTGFPIVDAAMRNLWATGWIANRARMIVASFLVKDLRITWTEGAAWFWDTLVDADLANNTLGWQWVAGCGADAAPYFRIFNPMLQSAKFDPEGEYIRKWIPELARLPNEYLHSPWKASAVVLKKAGILLGKDYPKPLVEHSEARKQALQYYDKIKTKK